ATPSGTAARRGNSRDCCRQHSPSTILRTAITWSRSATWRCDAQSELVRAWCSDQELTLASRPYHYFVTPTIARASPAESTEVTEETGQQSVSQHVSRA